MLLLTSTNDKVQVVTASGSGGVYSIDTQASYVDLDGTTVTPGRLNKNITTATTTDVVAAPSGTAKRNVKLLSVRNKHATAVATVTIQHTDGTTTVQLDQRVLGPGQSVIIADGYVSIPTPSGGDGTKPWWGQLAGASAYGDPDRLMAQMQSAGNVAPTPTNISTSIARCSAFRVPADMTVNRIRYYGVGATTNVYRVALYRYSDRARLMAETAFTTTANTWGSIGSALNVSLTADVLYFIAVSVNATGTTAGVGAKGGTIAATTGQVQATPAALPGSLALGGGYQSAYEFQFAVTSGALPDPAATLAAQAAWTGGMPAFWLDSADV